MMLSIVFDSSTSSVMRLPVGFLTKICIEDLLLLART